MKKWSNPELKNLELESTKATQCPLIDNTRQVSIGDCLKCGWNGHNYRCDKCNGCTHPDWEPGKTDCWPAHKACDCKQGS